MKHKCWTVILMGLSLLGSVAYGHGVHEHDEIQPSPKLMAFMDEEFDEDLDLLPQEEREEVVENLSEGALSAFSNELQYADDAEREAILAGLIENVEEFEAARQQEAGE